MTTSEAIERRFWSKVAIPDGDGCMIWLGGKTNGYGRFKVDRLLARAHRVAYALRVGPIPLGQQLDHLCRNRSCVRPDHLEAVTQQENIRRAEAAGGDQLRRLNAERRARTHCPQGHPYDAENTSWQPNGCRRCRTCHREREAARQRAKRQQGRGTQLVTQERAQKTAQRPARARQDKQDQQDAEDAAAARVAVRNDIAATWWPERR